jgi:hypothetical protein
LIDLASTTPLTNVTFSVLLPTDRLTALTVDNLVPARASGTVDLSQSNIVALTFTALPGQSLSGTQQLARLNFTAPEGQSSAFVPLNFSGISAVRTQPGLAPTVLHNDGRAVVVNGQPLLEAHLASLGARTLTLYGLIGTNYMIETSSIPANPISWAPWHSMTLSNLFGTTGADEGTNAPLIFYRVKQ